eukprot:c21119_g1_i1.p1 GENE.c21119_g1_i1~~c21119_g1_i1.p1  ORF type:complete len:162 (+),score=8.23 c21119_g1_i1:187-672(+)
MTLCLNKKYSFVVDYAYHFVVVVALAAFSSPDVQVLVLCVVHSLSLRFLVHFTFYLKLFIYFSPFFSRIFATNHAVCFFVVWCAPIQLIFVFDCLSVSVFLYTNGGVIYRIGVGVCSTSPIGCCGKSFHFCCIQSIRQNLFINNCVHRRKKSKANNKSGIH